MLIKENQSKEHITNLVKTIIQDDIQSVFLNKRKKDRMTYTLHHELGHLAKALEKGFSLSYMRIGNRIIYRQDDDYFTFKTKNKNQQAGGSFSVPSQNVTLTAQWTRNIATIRYNANGGSGAPPNQTKIHAGSVFISLSNVIPTRTGYTFNGWNTQASGTGTKYLSGASYVSNNDLTLYAVWKRN